MLIPVRESTLYSFSLRKTYKTSLIYLKPDAITEISKLAIWKNLITFYTVN